MDDDGNLATIGIKNENEYFQEQESFDNKQQNDDLNIENEANNQDDDQSNTHLNEDNENSQEENDENDEEEEEEDEDSDDDITITINEIQNTQTANANDTSFSSSYQPVNLNLNKRGPSFGPGGQITNLINTTTINKSKTAGLDIEAAGQYNGQSIFDLNLDSLEDKPWRKPGADITDYFNYGFTEETWKIYCDRQKRLRNEVNPNETNGTLNGNDRILSTPNNLSNNINQNGNNIVLRTFTNNVTTSNNTNLTQIKNEISSINENSKYGGTGIQKKAGPPPGRKQFGQIEVINSGAQANAVATVNNQNPPQINNLPPINNTLQQQRRQPDVKENFIQVIGPRSGNPNQQIQMPPNQMGGMPPPFNLPPIQQYNNLPPPTNQLEFNQMMQNQINYPPPNDFMNQPPQIRFPPNQVLENMMGFNDQQESANRDNNPLFRDQDQDERRNNDYSHRLNRNNYSLNRDYRDEDYRRSRDNRDQYENRYRSSRDKDYESLSRRSRSPASRRSPISSRRSRHDRSRSKERDSRRSRERSKERRRDRYKDRDTDKDKKEKSSRDHKSSSSSSSSHKRDRKIKEEPEVD